MKIHEIREMKNEELIKRIEEEERSLIDLRFSHQLKQLTNTAKLKITRKDLARMKTVLGERKRSEQRNSESSQQSSVSSAQENQKGESK